MKWILALSVFVISFTVTLGAFSSRDYSQSAQNTTNQAQTSDLGNVSGVASSSTEVLAVNTSVNALYLSPETQNVPVGQTFQVQVKLNAVTNVNAVEANISYPTNRLTVQSISNGSFGIEAAKTFSNGNINLAYGNISPLTGDILVATITFQTTSAGTANVTFGNSTVASSATNQNVLQETNNATYTVGTTATSTPTPIPPTPTPTGTQNPQDDIFPWIPTDIGSPLQGGQTKVSDGNYNIIGSGADIWFANDSFRYAYQARTGDFTLTTQVTGLTNTDQWAKAGLMIRESSAANSKYAFVFVTPGTNGVNFEYRNSTGANSAQSGTISGVSSIPTWLRITKTGNSFTAFRSTNGTTWTQQGSPVTISMATTLAGMAVTSHDASAFATGQFRNLAFSAVVTPTIPPTATPTPPPSATPTPSATSIRFSGPTTVANGQTFDVQVRVNASQTVNAVETNVTFPSNLIDALSVSNAGGGFEVEASKAITSGNVNLAYGTTTPKSGDVLVATITFRAKAVGSANFTHQNAQVISNVTNQNVLGSVQNGGLTITSSTTPTVQPTATTAPSPTPTRTPTPTLAPSPTVQPKNAALSFSPATSSVANGANFTVQVRVNSPQSINALETNVTFPTALLNVVSISNSGGGFEVEASKTISGNTINLAYGTTTPKTGNQLVATITFQAKAAGTAALAHTNAVVLSSITNKDVLGSVTGGSYTITAVSTPTPTPTRTPTPSPTLTSTPTISPTTVPGGTILSFNPTSGTFNNNSEFDVQVRLAADENVNAIETNVTFPTSLLEVVSISKEGGAFDVEASKTVNGGTINLAYGSTTPRTGNQLVTTIKFRAKAVGIADIRHTNAQVLSSATNQNVLDNVAPVSYTITASVTPSISISPTGLTCDPNNDGIINIVDFQWWKDEYFKVRTTTISDCFNPNGKVDLLDFQGWKDRFFGN